MIGYWPGSLFYVFEHTKKNGIFLQHTPGNSEGATARECHLTGLCSHSQHRISYGSSCPLIELAMHVRYIINNGRISSVQAFFINHKLNYLIVSYPLSSLDHTIYILTQSQHCPCYLLLPDFPETGKIIIYIKYNLVSSFTIFVLLFMYFARQSKTKSVKLVKWKISRFTTVLAIRL